MDDGESATRDVYVTPYVGVWIEILSRTKKLTIYDVTPYVGVWIEIREIAKQESRDKSPPMWGCGLK